MAHARQFDYTWLRDYRWAEVAPPGPSPTQTWTREHLIYVVAAYRQVPIATQAAALGRSKESVMSIWRALHAAGVLRREDRAINIPWSPEEKALVVRLAGHATATEIVRTIHARTGRRRSVGAVRHQATLLGLTLEQDCYTPEALVGIFGHSANVVEGLIQEGLLPFVRTGRTRSRRYVDDGVILDLARSRPWVFNVERLSTNPSDRRMVTLLRGILPRSPWLTAQQAAARLGLERRTVRRYLREGRLEVHQLNTSRSHSPHVIRLDHLERVMLADDRPADNPWLTPAEARSAWRVTAAGLSHLLATGQAETRKLRRKHLGNIRQALVRRAGLPASAASRAA